MQFLQITIIEKLSEIIHVTRTIIATTAPENKTPMKLKSDAIIGNCSNMKAHKVNFL
jgi:hypothetical protein